MGDGYTYLGTILIGRSYENRRKYLTVDVISGGNLTLAAWSTTVYTPSWTTIYTNFDYRINGGSWSTTNDSSVNFSVSAGDKVEIRLNSSSTYARSSSATAPIITGGGGAKFKISGNIQCLQAGDGFANITSPINCSSLFRGSSGLISAEDLLLPTNLSGGCYQSMFQNCSSLTGTPELGATTLASSCYTAMFRNCTSLTTAPDLPATTLVNGCYSEMFYGCSSLNYINAAFTTMPGAGYTNNWVYSVASTGLFVKNDTATWILVGNNGVPTGWVVSGGTTPEEQAGTNFGGLYLAPGDLYYTASTFQIMSNWSARCSYNVSSGLTNGSTFFTRSTLAGTSNFSYGEYSDWRVPDGEEMAYIYAGQKTRSEGGWVPVIEGYREGATLYTNDGAVEHAYSSWVILSGLTSLNGSTSFGRNWQVGLLVYPDEAVIMDGLGAISSTHTNSSGAISTCLVGSGPATIQPTGLTHMMSLGCVFIPMNGFINWDTNGYIWNGQTGLSWSSDYQETPDVPVGTAIYMNGGQNVGRFNVELMDSTSGSYYYYLNLAGGTCRPVRGSMDHEGEVESGT